MYNFKISNIRAFAIISVVLGHSIILYSSKWHLMPTDIACPFFDYLKDFINLYQMEIFFFISGYLTRNSFKQDFKSFFSNKVKRLIIPYFCIGLFYMLPIKILLSCPFYQNKDFISIIGSFIIGSNNGHLWFIYALFFIFILYKSLNNITEKLTKQFYFIVLAIAFIVQMAPIQHTYFNINSILFYGLWFQAGVCCQYQKAEYVFLPIFIFNLILKNIPSCISCLIVFILVKTMPNKKNGLMEYISKRSYGIYLIHSPLIYITYTYIPNANPIIIFLINFFVGGFISLLFTNLIGNSKLRFIIGEKYK